MLVRAFDMRRLSPFLIAILFCGAAFKRRDPSTVNTTDSQPHPAPAEATRTGGDPDPSVGAAPTPPAAAVIHSDVDDAAYKTEAQPDNVAVVVGIEKYSGLPAAEFAARDARAVREHLRALGYPERNIMFLTDQAATRAGLAKALNSWLPNRAKEESTVFFYYSGHGAPDVESGQAYLVPVDGDPEDLGDTAYPLKEVYQKLGKLKAKRVIVALDSCFSGAGGRSLLAKGTRPLVTKIDTGGIEPGKVVALTAADSGEISGTLDEQGHGAFTYYLLKGLNGAAKDKSGHVTVRSLYDYLAPKVGDAARLHNRDQTPQLLPAATNETAGSILR